MNRGRISISVFLCFLMMMFLVVIGCGSSDDAVLPGATYSISGTVTYAVGGAPMSGVTMNLTGYVTAPTTTAADGTYSFSGIPAGTNGAVVPVKTGYTFDPLSNGGTLTANVTNANFAATANTGLPYTISGTVSGAVLAGVTITLSGDAAATTTTIAGGTYSFPAIALNGNYNVTPSKTGYTFSAASLGVIVSGADATGNNFTATANAATTYSISGHVTGDTIEGVTITLTGDTFGTAITKTGVGGTYSFAGLLPGDYTVTPSKTAYTFLPVPISITLSGNSSGNNFVSTVVLGVLSHSISGMVSGAIADGVTINLTGAATNSDLTASGGSYSFGSLADGAYTVTPVLAGYTFAPSSMAVTISGGNGSGDFTATANVALKYSISGTVSGTVQSGVTITLAKGGVDSGTTSTNASGNYSFSNLVAGSYTVTPFLTGYTFSPTILSPTISSAIVTGQNFVASTPAVTWSQANLAGTWRMNMLRRGFRDDGTTPRNEWMRAKVTIDSAGVATCVSASQMSYTDSVVTTGCPSPFNITFTMNTTTGVITQTGAQAADVGNHMTMTSNKNFAAGTATSGNPSYQLVIIQKDNGTYSTTDMNSQSFVYHQLWVGASVGSNMWSWGTGSTNGSGVATMTYECSSHACPETPGGGGTLSVATTGVVTMSGDPTWEGFLSADKKTIVGTSRSSNDDGGQVSLMIVQVTGTEFTAGTLPAGVSAAHMLGTGTGFAGWIHNTTTVAPGGVITFSDWASSFGGSAPVGTRTGHITTTSGTYLIAEDPTYHGQISHDGKFTVGTQTSNGSYYFLNVTTK